MSTDPLSLEEITRRALWELSAEAAGIGTYVLHLSSGQMDMDERALALTGLTGATGPIRPEDVFAHIPAEEVPDVAAAIDHAVATGGAYSAEHRMVDPDGTWRWVAVRGQTLVDDAGTTTALVGALYDITALREATDRVAQVLESMAVGYLSVDADWRITHVNAEAERIMNIPRADLTGQDLWASFPAAVGTPFESSYRRAMATDQVVTFDAHYPQPLDVWVEVRATPERGGLALYFLDITARRAAQDEADRSTRRLAALGEVALALADADDVTDLVTVMTDRGLTVLGADGSSIAVPDPTDPTHLLSYITRNLAEDTRADFGRLPLDAALGVTVAATTGRRVLLADQAACEAFSSHVVAANAATGCQAWASMPLRADGRVIGVLTAGWKDPQSFDAEQLDLLETFAAQCAQTLQRLAAREAEQAATAGALRAAAQQATLVAVARALGEAQGEADVLAVIADRGVQLLGGDGWALCLQEPDGTHLRILTTGTDGADVRGQLQRVPVDLPLPAVHCALTGTPFFHADRAETLAAFPGAEDVDVAADVQASAAVPLRAHGHLLGCLSLSSRGVRAWRSDERDLLAALAALTAQALDRLAAREAERTASAATARFSEILQRSLLTSPPEPDHLQIAVRYVPATADAQVGGDWYDAFITGDGTTSLVIGDVAGHDSRAAAAMGQMRNLLRGIAHAIGASPAAVLSALDRAVHDLDVTALATIVLAQVEQPPQHRAAGTRVLRWSNAGHPPPLLITPDGAARFLDTDADLLIGIDPDAERGDHTVVLEEGATVLFLTDGLVERRGASLDVGLTWLAETAGHLTHLPLDQLCDELLARVGGQLDDDVALLALRAHPEDHPRPADAGPARDPLHTPTPSPTGDHGHHGEGDDQEGRRA